MAWSPITMSAICLAVLGVSQAACPSGWVHHGPSCYMFSADKQAWQTAQNKCKSFQGGYLAEVETTDENAFLENIARNNKLGYWLGGKDDKTEGHWYWANSGNEFDFTDWSPNEPNNLGNVEDCLHLFISQNDHWNDFNCANAQNYICEASFQGSGR